MDKYECIFICTLVTIFGISICVYYLSTYTDFFDNIFTKKQVIQKTKILSSYNMSHSIEEQSKRIEIVNIIPLEWTGEYSSSGESKKTVQVVAIIYNEKTP